jgi:phenylalanyl-tRNA synthetase alpha chain
MQLEGLYVDEKVKIGQLFWILKKYYSEIFGDEIDLRFRPHHFPFTEPSIEFDTDFRGKWLELGGAGMVNPIVIKNMGLNPDKYTGFAFGPGVERPIMVRYGISDVRSFRSSDLRFLKQF